MTTFQDPPPHSRRALRQSEQNEGSVPTPDQGVPYAFDAAAHDPAQPPSATPPHTGRRVQQPPSTPADDGSGFEPLTYSTQGRVSPPPSEHSRQQTLASAPPPSGADESGYRVRDFSPEGSGRRAAVPREQAPGSPLTSPGAFPGATRSVDLDYQTQGVPPTAAHSAQSVPAEDALNHTLSRRELREMRAAAEQAAPPLQMPPMGVSEPIDALLNSGPIEIPTLAPPPGQSQALADAMAEFDMLTRSRREAEARARDAQVASLANPIVLPPVVQPSAPQPPVAEQPPVAPQPVAPPQLVFPPMQPSVPEPAPQQTTAQASVPEAPVMQQSIPQPSEPQAPMLVNPVFIEPELPQASAPEVSQPQVHSVPLPTGSDPTTQEIDAHGGRSPRASNHWRVQAAMEDDDLPYENTLSRTVGANTSAITTSALVLPSVPQPDVLGSLTATGEILVTGSISLPRSLGSTGAHPDRVDNSDFEEDPFDSQVAAPDSAPVRAIRAISSNTSTRGVIETKKPQGNRMLTGVIITAGVLCVGLLGVLIFAIVSGKL